MWIYSHTNYTLKGYTRLTHEAVQFTENEISEVTEEVGNHLLGTHPLQFCQVSMTDTMEKHQTRCALFKKQPQQVYNNRRLGRPPKNRELRTA